MNWQPPSKHARFEGDAGMSDLRHRLSLDPDLVPQPPARMQRGPVGRSLLAKISLCVGLVAIVTYTVVEINLPYIDRSIAPNDASITKTARLIATSAEIQSMAGTRLVVENRQAFTDEPLPFGVVLAGATGGGSVFLNALLKGTRLSAGDWLGPAGWSAPRGLRLGAVEAQVTDLAGPLIVLACSGYDALTRDSTAEVRTAYYIVDGKLWGFGLLPAHANPCR